MKRWSPKVARTSNKKVFMEKKVKARATRRSSLTTRKPMVTMRKLRKAMRQQPRMTIKKLPKLPRKTTT